MKDKIAKSGDFARVLDDSFSKYGVSKDDNIYLAGDMFLRDKEKDPYSYRKVFIASYMIGDHIDTKRKPFTIDGKRVRPLGDKIQERLTAIKKEDFNEEASSEVPN